MEGHEFVTLQKQNVKIEPCQRCQSQMVNVDPTQVEQGDLTTLKRLGVRLSNPETKDPICMTCDVEVRQIGRAHV